MAKPPNIWEKIGYIWRFILDPCDAPVTVYVEYGTPEIVDALILYFFQIDPKNTLTAAVRPTKAISRQRGQRKGKVGYKAGRMDDPGILRRALGFDANDELGKRIPGATEIRGREVTAGVAKLWIIEGFLENFLNWWMIINLVIDVLFNWTSAMMKTEYCMLQNATTFLAEGEASYFLPIVPYYPVTAGNIRKQRGDITWSQNGFILGNKTVVFMLGLDLEAVTDNPTSFEVTVWQGNPGTGEVLASVAGTVPGGGSTSAALEVEITGPTSIGCWISASGPAIWLRNIEAFATDV